MVGFGGRLAGAAADLLAVPVDLDDHVGRQAVFAYAAGRDQVFVLAEFEGDVAVLGGDILLVVQAVCGFAHGLLDVVFGQDHTAKDSFSRMGIICKVPPGPWRSRCRCRPNSLRSSGRSGSVRRRS